MTSKITLAASAMLVALSSAAVASTPNVAPRHHVAQAFRQAFDFAAPNVGGRATRVSLSRRAEVERHDRNPIVGT